MAPSADPRPRQRLPVGAGPARCRQAPPKALSRLLISAKPPSSASDAERSCPWPWLSFWGRRSGVRRARCRACRGDRWPTSVATRAARSNRASDALDHQHPGRVGVHDRHFARRRRSIWSCEQGERTRRGRRRAQPRRAGSTDRARRPTETAVTRPRLVNQQAGVAARATRQAARARGRQRAPARVRFRADAAARMIQRPESGLSVRPISTCFASLVTLTIAQPRSPAVAVRQIATRQRGRRCRPPQAALHRGQELGDLRLRRIGPSGSGIRSILRRFCRAETMVACRPRVARCSRGELRRARERGVLLRRWPFGGAPGAARCDRREYL